MHQQQPARETVRNDSPLTQAAVGVFARHETFPPRYGWLRKAFAALEENPEVFLEQDAPVVLGVGKNMVAAIRYWSQAFKLTVEHPRAGTSRGAAAAPTWQACWLLSDEGADPYLEDPGSLWLLHWWLLAPPCRAPTWWAAFHLLPSAQFSHGALADTVERHASLAGWRPPAAASIGKDVDCLVRMYSGRNASGSPGGVEDLVNSPFRELGLLHAAPDSPHTWWFTSIAEVCLPAPVAAYACLDFASRQEGSTRGSISLARLAGEPGSPGRAFRLRQPALATMLEHVTAGHPNLQVTVAVGQQTMVFDQDPQVLAWDILDAYYDHARQRVPDPAEWDRRHPQRRTDPRYRRSFQPALFEWEPT